MLAGSWIRAISRIPATAAGAAQNVDGESTRQQMRPRTIAPTALRTLGLVLAAGLLLAGRLWHQARSPPARRRQHARVADGVEARWGHARRQAAQQPQRVHVDCQRSVGPGLLQQDPYQPVGSMLHALER